ncbi:hypothetical protein ACROYT_G032992 [Oculina patagonica]
MLSVAVFCVLALGVPFSQGNEFNDDKDEIRGSVECGTKVQGTRIVGGTDAVPGAWPWQVTMDFKAFPALSHWCGGSIVSPQWIVSAAHCFYFSDDPNHYTIVAGDHDLSKKEVYEQNTPIEKVIKHPQYDAKTSDYDLALIKLQSPLTYNNRVRPVCLPKFDFAVRTKCYVTGWGTTKEGGNISQILQQAPVPLVRRKRCQRAYQDLDYTITPRMLCAGYAKGRIDSCQGDSGGPLVCTKGGKWYLTGTVSWGQGCARKRRYGVYADMMELKDWVQKAIKEN